MSMPSGELLRGILPQARLGLTDFDLILTDRRIVAAKVGSSGWAQAGGGLIGAAVSLAGQDARRAKYAGMDVNQVLAANKKNFEIAFQSIETGEFNAGISRVTLPTLTLWTTEGKKRFMFTHSYWKKNEAQVQTAKDLLSAVLPGKVTFKRI